MSNYTNNPEIPMGLGMALAQNLDAMNRFAALPAEAKLRVIEGAHSIRSKEEMQAFMQSMISCHMI